MSCTPACARLSAVQPHPYLTPLHAQNTHATPGERRYPNRTREATEAVQGWAFEKFDSHSVVDQMLGATLDAIEMAGKRWW